MINCEHAPTAQHTYGVYEIAGKPRSIPMNTVNLCDDCGKFLWDKISGSVAAGHMHYAVTPLAKGLAND